MSELLALGFSGQGLNEAEVGDEGVTTCLSSSLFLSILEPEGQLW